MPQVWLTYDELGEMFGLDAATARSEVIANGWPRRRSSDSLTRVKLPPAAAHEYILGYVASANPRAGAARDASPVAALQKQAEDLAAELAQRTGTLTAAARQAIADLSVPPSEAVETADPSRDVDDRPEASGFRINGAAIATGLLVRKAV